MTFDDHAFGYEESVSSAELASYVANHARVHIGLTISSYIRFLNSFLIQLLGIGNSLI